MKKLSVLIFSIVIFYQSNAQSQRVCGTDEYMKYLMQQDPKLEQRLIDAEQIVQQYIRDHPNGATTREIINIPTVVHVVYKTAAQNLSDEQVLSQIDVLNQDYQRLNSDTNETPAAFKSLAANCEISFCLAQRDPDGNPTTGIVRVETTVSNFDVTNEVKHTDDGGSDAWDVDKYFNIWVCDLADPVLGYGQFPLSNNSDNFGLVVHYEAFGTIGDLLSGYKDGRTSTHEGGHCFNLRHIWGDDGTSCTGTDYVDDTPNQADENYGCPNFPHLSCTNGPNGDMFMNYMDYTNDDCKNMFSEGQKERMLANINSFLSTLLTSEGCIPVVNLDAGLLSQKTVEVCALDYSQKVTLKNYGLNTLTSCDIIYSVDGGSNSTYNWTGVLPHNGSIDITLPSVTLTPGVHTFNVNTSNPNSLSDEYTLNDAVSVELSVVIDVAAWPVKEDFSGVNFPPTDWKVTNNDLDITWAKGTTGYNSSESAFMHNFIYATRGEIDDLTLPHVNLTAVSNPKLTFYLAYQLYTNPDNGVNHSDTLEVFVSTDCGVTFKKIYKKYFINLTTVIPNWSHTEFVPTDISQWRLETVDLTPYATSDNAIIRFRQITDDENNLYIDKINIVEPVGIEEIDPLSFDIFPNPASSNIIIGLNAVGKTQVKITDALGRIIFVEECFSAKEITIDLSKFVDGNYFVTATSSNGTDEKHFEVIK
ncbi:MAG: choice-of-anchor J domain-containing protein [Chitinophagales bacterium]|nr:choice-of-anchor J domain-containing protein [Chitinophagales bacterium]